MSHAHVQQYVPPDVTNLVPPYSPAPAPAYPMPFAPPPPPQTPPRMRLTALEVLVAVLLPLIICSFGGWIYFVYAGARRQDNRLFLAAVGYGAGFAAALAFAMIDPTPVGNDDLSVAEWIGFTIFAAVAVVSSVHGGIVAAQPGDSPRRRRLRDEARHFAAFDPGHALRLGIGRPDLPRSYDDGGLIDINHVPGHVLARLGGLSSDDAHRIVMDRLHRGPYARPEDLVMRGLLEPKALHRLASRLICVPPG
jgi:hypothetical protein